MNTSKTIDITPQLIADIRHGLSFGLTKGLGKPQDGQMCVEALICAKLGLPHSDNPPCVGSEVCRAKIALNDCNWSSKVARAKGMAKLAIAQLNSIMLDQKEFKQRLKLKSMQKILPYLIQKHFEEIGDVALLDWKTKFEQVTELNNNLWKEFYNYYCYDYYDHYYYYNYSYYYSYNYYNFGDEFLLIVADTILQVLIDMKSPGVEWFDKEL